MSPDRRKHRGPHPQDVDLFSDAQLQRLRKATTDLSWLLGRSYAPNSSLKLVGDRYQLTDRQRIAVRRAACSDETVALRRSSEIRIEDLEDNVAVDGFNLIVTVEAALAGGVLLRCRDGTIRDLASVHGSYRKVEETAKAIELIAGVLAGRPSTAVSWFLDSPVSNSGRLATMLRAFGSDSGYRWDVKLVYDADRELVASRHPVATSDSRVIDEAERWINLTRCVLEGLEPQAWVIDLETPLEQA